MSILSTANCGFFYFLVYIMRIVVYYICIIVRELVIMSGLGNKDVMARNLKRYMEETGKTQKELAELVDVPTSTFNGWVKGNRYPRIDKIEMLANYFGCLKSDLIEDKDEMRKNSDAIADIIIRLRADPNYFRVVNKLRGLDATRLAKVEQLLLLLDTFTE